MTTIFISFSGKSSFGYPDESHLLDDSGLDQSVLSSPSRASPNSTDRVEHYSRKVFVGGLPPDIDEGNIYNFREYNQQNITRPVIMYS